MDTSLKQRLLGAALLVALAVIFIPMLFDGTSREEPVALDMDIPPQPKYTFEQRSKGSSAVKPAHKTGSRAQRGEPPTDVADLDKTRKPRVAPELTQAPEPPPKGAPRPAEELANAPTPPPRPSSAVKPAEQTEAGSETAPRKQQVATAPRANPPVTKPQAPDAPAPPPQAAVSPKPPSVAPATPLARPSSDEPLTAWAVQVGSFSEHENATSLRDQLRASGFAAFEERSITEGEQVFRVKVGPEFNRERAEALESRLRSEEDLKGIVVSYPPAQGN